MTQSAKSASQHAQHGQEDLQRNLTNRHIQLIAIGGAIGAVAVIADEALARTGSGAKLPPLGVGLGI